jgi:hypothetical protein
MTEEGRFCTVPLTKGDRVRLEGEIALSDAERAALGDEPVPRAGDMGRVAFVDSVGTAHVDWDNGARIGLVHGVDRYSLVDETEAG